MEPSATLEENRMPSARNLSRLILGLLGCLGLAGLGLRCGPDRPGVPAKEGTAVEAVQEAQEIQIEDRGRLEPGRGIEEKLQGGAGHRYEIEMKAGQYIQVVVMQKGVDVAIQLFTPTREGRPVVDSPNGKEGPEEVFEVADAGGVYHLEVRAGSDREVPAGDYSVSIVEARDAKEEDRMRSRASIRFAEAEGFRREGTREGLQAALASYQEALPLWRVLVDRVREADTLERLGWVHLNLNELLPSQDASRQARALYADLGMRPQEGVTVNRLCAALYGLGDFQGSLNESLKARAAFREIGYSYAEAAALNHAGNAYLALGQVQKALDAFERALLLAREGKNISAESNALFGRGDAFLTQGKLDLALDSLENALAVEDSQDAPGSRANVLRRIADVLQRMERLPESQQHLEQALAIQRSIGDLQGEVVTLHSLGTVLLLQGKLEEARPPYLRALEICHQIKSPDKAFSLLNLGRYHHAAGDPRRAFELNEEAAALFRETEDAANEASALFGSARALHDLADYSSARERLEKVLERIELLREAPTSTNLRTSYLATKQHYFDLYVDVLMHLHQQDKTKGWDGQALQINERRRARGLLDLLAEARTEVRQGADPSLIERERRLEEQASALEITLAAEGRGGSVEKELRAVLAELDDVQTKIRSSSPRFRELTAAPLEIEEIQKQVLDPDSLMLVYSLGDERSFLWLLGNDGEIESHVLPARSRIDDMARLVYKAWSRRGGQGREGHWESRLGELLLGPVAARLGSKRLLIVSDGSLQYLPFGALPDPTMKDEKMVRRLLWKHEVVHLPSASVVAGLRRDFGDRMPPSRHVAVLADPVFSRSDERFGGMRTRADGLPDDLERSARDLGISEFERLPFTGIEAEALRGLVGEDKRFEALGFEANRSVVTSGELKRYRVVHFATHGVLNEKHPEMSGLVLSLHDSKGQRQDGFLRGYEICRLGLRAELVVLSACQTGLGEDVRGEGLVGLTRSFMYAGAPRLVVSLWNVNDRSTAELMRRFYRGMYAHRLTPAAALRCTQLSMMNDRRWNDPYHWAPFVFQGEWLSRIDGSKLRGDEGIEVAADGGAPPKRSDNSLPLPGDRPVPPGCPEVL